MMPSEANRRTVRRSRSTVQVAACPRFRTRTTSPQGWSGRIRRTVGQPGVQPRQDALQMRGVAARAQLCGWRLGHRRAGQDCRRRGRVHAPPFRPALVRSAISARSSWATAPSTCKENMPCGVEVSIGSRRLRKCAPLPRVAR